ncbi:MAG: extracellular solute-binding protein [Clostridia bacterium]|nr:extracellular solute-binding protein [Clostridia bacterium]
MKKFVSLILLVAMMATMLSVPAMADDTVTLKVMLWDRGDAPAGGTVENSKMTTYINDQIKDLGIQVEFVSTPRSGSDDKLVTWMAGGSAPDIIFTYGQGTFLSFALQGGLTDLGPAIAKLGEGNNIETYVGDVMNMGNINGAQYALLSKRGAANPRHTAYIRQDWLDELGLPMPTTKQELIDTLYKFKEAKPDCIPWAMNGRTDTEKTYLNFVGSYVDFADLKDEYKYSEGYIVMHDGALDGIRELNRLYNDGIIGQDFATDTTEDLFKAAVSSGNVGFVLDDNTRIFDYMEALNCENGQQVRTTFVPVSAFTKADGEIRNPFEYAYGMYIMVPITSESKVDAAITYLNWLADPVNAENVAYAPEHTVDETTGVPVPFTGDQLSEMGYKTTLDDFNILNKHFLFTEAREGVIAGYQGSNIFETYDWFANLYDTLQVGFFRYPTMPMAPEVESEKGDTVKADMIKYVYRLVSAPTDQFDSLQSELYANLVNAGLNQILDARDAYYTEVVGE